MRSRLGLVAVLVLGLTACGTSDGVTATAKSGDAFCRLAQAASDDNDAFEAVDSSDSAKVKLELGAAIDSLDAAVAKAPKDIADTAKTLLSKEEQLEKLLKANDYDFTKVLQTDEGKKLSNDKEAKQAGDDFKAYLSDKCGIESSAGSTPVDTTPVDTAPSDTAPPDTAAAGDTSVDTIVDLGEGEDAINAFLDYYELGAKTNLTSDERSCIVSQLVGKVTGSELNQAVAGQASPELQQALGLAFINCNVTVQS